MFFNVRSIRALKALALVAITVVLTAAAVLIAPSALASQERSELQLVNEVHAFINMDGRRVLSPTLDLKVDLLPLNLLVTTTYNILSPLDGVDWQASVLYRGQLFRPGIRIQQEGRFTDFGPIFGLRIEDQLLVEYYMLASNRLGGRLEAQLGFSRLTIAGRSTPGVKKAEYYDFLAEIPVQGNASMLLAANKLVPIRSSYVGVGVKLVFPGLELRLQTMMSSSSLALEGSFRLDLGI